VWCSGREGACGGGGPDGPPPLCLVAHWQRAWLAELDALQAGIAAHALTPQWCARERACLVVEQRAVLAAIGRPKS
jgi:hypothetical protein